jgi:hypothetical protein
LDYSIVGGVTYYWEPWKDLLNDWVCEGIAIELEEYENPVNAYKYINKRYKVSDDRARELLLDKISETKLGDFVSMTEYVNKHRQLKADLKKAKHTCTDSQFVTNVLYGLPDNYRETSRQYDWVRATNPDNPPDLDFLFDRLYIEDEEQKRSALEKKAKEKAKKDKSKDNKSKDNDKSKEKCTFEGCEVGTY